MQSSMQLRNNKIINNNSSNNTNYKCRKINNNYNHKCKYNNYKNDNNSNIFKSILLVLKIGFLGPCYLLIIQSKWTPRKVTCTEQKVN